MVFTGQYTTDPKRNFKMCFFAAVAMMPPSTSAEKLKGPRDFGKCSTEIDYRKAVSKLVAFCPYLPSRCSPQKIVFRTLICAERTRDTDTQAIPLPKTTTTL